MELVINNVEPNFQQLSCPAAPRGKYILARYILLMRLSGNVEDVVVQHHQCNCPLQLPDNRELTTIRNRQASQHSRSVSCTNSIVEADGVDAPISQCSHAAYLPGDTNSPAISLPQSAFGSIVSGLRPDNADSSQLSFYPPPM